MSGFRRYGRKPLRYEVKFSHAVVGEISAETQDISDSGIFVRCAEMLGFLSIGEIIYADLISDSERFEDTQLKVVRLTDDGVGLAFE